MKKRMKILFRTGFPKAIQDQLSGLSRLHVTAGSRFGSGKSATCGRHLATSHTRLMSDSARFLQDQDDLMCSNSGYPQLTTEQMSQLLSSIQQSQPGLLQQVPQINSVDSVASPPQIVVCAAAMSDASTAYLDMPLRTCSRTPAALCDVCPSTEPGVHTEQALRIRPQT